jgi:hypothetical protein
MGLEFIDSVKLASLREIRRPQVFELVGVYWPAPDLLRFYCSTRLSELPQFPAMSVITAPIEPRLPAYSFQSFSHVSDIGDDSIQLEYSDIDGEISRLFFTHGEGVKVELFYYFPQVDLLVSQWWGHFRPPDSADGFKFPAKAQSGFRSALLTLPRRFLGTRCGFIFGGRFATQAEIDLGGCPWNLHIGGSTGVAGSDLLPPCNQSSRAVCTLYLGDSLSFGGFETVIESIINNQTKGPALLATSRGNETNLKRPLRVIYGHRVVKDLDLLAFTPQLNTKHPDQGFVRCLFAVGDDQIQSMFSPKVNGSLIGFEHLNVRLGELRQPATGFSPNVSNYSGTSLFFGVYGPVNAGQYNKDNLKGEAEVYGRNTIRVYTDPNTYTLQYTTNRAWCLLDLYTNKRYGHGISFSRFVIQDWIDLAAWCNELVGYSDAEGVHFTGTRSTFNAELNERTAQQTIEDICRAGRFGLPFRHNGKIRIVPLRKETIDGTVPVFTDQGENRNILISENGNSSLTWSQKSDADLINQLVVTFEDAAHLNVERPLTFEDQDAQVAAGKAMGDDTIRIVRDQVSALGVTALGEAARLGNLTLDLGAFDDGGLRNNLTVKFMVNATGLAMELWKYRVIKVVSPKITRFGFQYFRVMERNRQSDLKMEIVAQAYPVDYYTTLEDSTQPPPITGSGGSGNPGGGSGDIPCHVSFTLLQHLRDQIEFQLEVC